jgi:undecaprenyl-diphosphatase
MPLMGRIQNRDTALMRRLNRWPAPRWVQLWMLGATRAGDGWLWYGVALIVLLFGNRNAFWAMIVSACIGMTLYTIIKRLTHRPRPCETEEHCWSTVLPPDKFSFPSGHTLAAFAVAVSLTRFYPLAAAPLFFAAGSIGASRMVLGMHYLSDVVAGALMGAFIAYSVSAVFMM